MIRLCYFNCLVYNHVNGTLLSKYPFNKYTGDKVTELKNNKTIIMKAYKYDGKLHYEQPLQLHKKNDSNIVLSGAKGRELTHYTRDAVYKFDQETLEFFFTDRWYTAALVFDDDGNVIHVYCNIALPCKISKDVVEFIDLDVDVVVNEGTIEVIDIDEFEEHKIIYGYSKDLQKKVFEAVDRVKKDIIKGNYPFNYNILKQG